MAATGTSTTQANGPAPGLQRILPNLYWFADTCNVYLLKDGERGLLFDFGSGDILDHLHEAGASRDRVGPPHPPPSRPGPGRLPPRRARHPDRRARDAKPPSSPRPMPSGASSASTTTTTSPASGSPCRAPSPSPGASTTTSASSGAATPSRCSRRPATPKAPSRSCSKSTARRVAVAGDLIAEPGAVHSIHDLQWQYGFPDGVGAALHSTLLVRSKQPDLVLGSHGHPMATGAASALDTLAANLRRLYEAQRELRTSRVWKLWPHAVDQPKQKLLPHLWANPHSCSNVYCLLADDGRGILLDYGFPSWDHFATDLRFVEHSLEDLKAAAGLTQVEAVIPSHYHDDHIAGVPFLQQEHGVQAWIFENFTDIVENPPAYNIPCLLPTPIRVDRTLKEGETLHLGRPQLHGLPHARPHLVGARDVRRGRRHADRLHRRQPDGRHDQPPAGRRSRLPQQDARRQHRPRRRAPPRATSPS